MIVFYTRYDVVETFDIKDLLELSFKCVTGMKNAPDTFKNISWDGSESREWKSGRNLLAYEIDEELELVAFRVSIVDDNDELWTEDVALNHRKHEIQLRLAREKKMVSAEYDGNFNLPYLFKKIIRDGIGGMDINLPINDKPIYIDENNIDIIKNVINGSKKVYALPIIYVSCPFGTYTHEVDVKELAKDMAGSAHVLVEKSSDISQILRKMTDDKNAYNGAVDVFYNDDYFRYIKRKDITSNQFRYKISHAIYVRMSMRNIDEMSSISTIRLKNKTRKLEDNINEQNRLKVEELEEKLKENKELFECASDENKCYEKKVNELENENHKLKSKIDWLMKTLESKRGKEQDSISLIYTERQIYEDEVKRFLLECIKKTVSTYGEDERKRRDYHILKDIIDNNSYSTKGNEIKKSLMSILRKDRLGKYDADALKELGFIKEPGGHTKYILNEDDRYIITVSSTPSDHRNGENLAHEALNLIFGRF